MIIALQALFLFRKSLTAIFEQFFKPYFENLLFFKTNDILAADDDNEDEVFAMFDDSKGVVFYPPVYAQRYAAVSDCLLDKRWSGKLEKVVDFGCNDMSFIKYLKDVPGVKEILGVDLEAITLHCSSDLKCDKYSPKRENPLKITLFQGNAADPDYRLIGCDAVVSIEMIEHMMPHDLDRFVHNIFGFIKPWVVVITTPNADFNLLFKALEKNGLRRLDHFFEWTREQFNDWSSNIVTRYPHYTVSCKGIGPGPTGTSHLGCCSQLALFVAKDYIKQADLNLNSLALVARMSSSGNTNDTLDSWDYSESTMENNMLCGPNSVQSLNDYRMSDSQSYVTFVIDTPIQPVECEDKTVQCNVKFEFERNFIMFDDDMYHTILLPRKQLMCKVYEIENVSNRLNCTNHQVKKFSKATHNLMAKNKLDALVNSREIVDEIRHLSKMLNFNKDTIEKVNTGHIWNNVNWGENAPYWNQYYKIVREHKYPYETKSDESRVLELISDEINRLIDTDSEQWFSKGDNKMEIPIDYLMSIINHITSDEEKVREMLEWNGYDVVGNVVVYSRLIVDNLSDDMQDWIDVDSVSDFATTDAPSILTTEGVRELDLCDRDLRRALDHKIRNLRKLGKNEDISTELDRVVCRLMKLALETHGGMKSPPPSSWLLYKLYDLLTLTENAMLRRKKYFIENCQKSIYYEGRNVSFPSGIEEDLLTDSIMETYQGLLSNSDEDNIIEYFNENELTNYELTNKTVITNNDVDDSENNIYQGDQDFNESIDDVNEEKEFANISPHVRSTDIQVINTIDINIEDYKNKIPLDDSQEMIINDSNDHNEIVLNKRKSIIKKFDSRYKKEHTNNFKFKKSKIIRKITTKRPSYINFFKCQTLEQEKYKIEDHQNHQIIYQNSMTTSSKPKFGQCVSDCSSFTDNVESRTQESMFMKIVTMDGDEETIAFRRSVGTDPDRNLVVSDTDVDVETEINVTKAESTTCQKQISVGETSVLFLNDINEPSTSEGIRHVTTDVQCGPDETYDFNTQLELANNISEIIPRRRKSGIKIEDSVTNLQNNEIYYNKNSDETIIIKKQSCIISHDESKIDQLLLEKTDSVVNPRYSVIITEDSDSLLKNENNPSKSKYQLFGKEYDVVNKSRVICRKPELSYGGIYVHCFKDKQNSEDIVYQGKWQRYTCNLKKVAKKNPIIYYNRRNDSMLKKKVVFTERNICNYSSNNIEHVKYKKTVTVRNPKVINATKKSKTKMQNYRHNDSTMKKNIKPARVVDFSKLMKRTKSITKVSSSKIATSITFKKSNKPSFSRNPLKTSTPVKEINYDTNICDINNYIPSYLRKRINKHMKDKNIRLNPNIVLNKYKSNKPLDEINLNNAGDTKNMIKKPPHDIQRNITYYVYRNELDSEKNNSKAVEEDSIKNYLPDSLPESPDSYSPCSSPNSIGTVRNISFRNKIDYNINYSTYSERSSSENYEPENDINKNRKVVRKLKSCKKPNTSTAARENKENITGSPRTYFKDDLIQEKRNKDTLMTPITIESPPFKNLALCKNKIVKGSIQSNNTKYPKGSSLTIKKSFSFDNNQSKSKSFNKRPSSNEHFALVNKAITFINEDVEVDNTIETDMRQLIEEYFHNLEIPSSDNKYINTKNQNSTDMYEIGPDLSNLTFDIASGLTTCDEKTESCSNSEKEYHKIMSIENVNSRSEIADTDLLSLKSTASMTTSKFSEYFSADNELDEDFFSQMNSNSNLSLRHDAFDTMQNLPNNDEIIIPVDILNESSINRQFNDHNDYFNSIDSETESPAGFVGHATSEELESGRSSDNTYESCSLDEDVPIPYWLFETNSEPEQREPTSIPLPIVEPELELNENVMEVVVVGAGAGDGRGIHSDVSRDSSGRGTSLSSSGTSSGLESQDTLSNLSDSDQLENVIEQQDIPASVLPNESSDGVYIVPGDHTRNSSGSPINDLNPITVPMDATMSSSADVVAVHSEN